jgi:chemotaxis receptor (MCP) glutamine deamidase CheD
MAHILMAGGSAGDTKYVKPALKKLIGSLSSFGGKDLNWVAKLTGGSLIIEGSNRLVMNAGRHTALEAFRLLVEEQYDVVGMHIGGDCRRGIYFDLATGQMQLKIEGSKLFENSAITI